MAESLEFIKELLSISADFLMVEPIRYFTGIVIVMAIASLVHRMTRM